MHTLLETVRLYKKRQNGRLTTHVTADTGSLFQLFDQRQSQGKVADGTSKESAIQQAGEMALKMYFKSQGQQQAGGFMGLASKFM